MTASLLNHLSAFAAPPSTFVPLLASILLLSLRAWVGVKGQTLARRDSILLNAAIGTLIILFLFFVLVRFVNLA